MILSDYKETQMHESKNKLTSKNTPYFLARTGYI